MSRRIQVWLLEPRPPTEAGQLSAWLRANARMPGRLPGWLAWLGPLGVWLWVRWWARRLLPGPMKLSPAEEAETRARALERTLGEAWTVRAVLGNGSPGLSEAAAHLSTGDRVALLLLCPLGGPVANSLRSEAGIAVSGRGGQLLPIPPLHGVEAWREAVAETLRATVADLPRNTNYEVLFCVFGLLGRGAEGADARQLVADVVARAALVCPHHLAFVPGPGVGGGDPALELAIGALLVTYPEALVLVPLNAADPAEIQPVLDALRHRSPELPVHVAPELRSRASALRALGDGLRAAAEAEEASGRPARSA